MSQNSTVNKPIQLEIGKRHKVSLHQVGHANGKETHKKDVQPHQPLENCLSKIHDEILLQTCQNEQTKKQ